MTTIEGADRQELDLKGPPIRFVKFHATAWLTGELEKIGYGANTRFYLPLATCLLLSVILSPVLGLVRVLRK